MSNQWTPEQWAAYMQWQAQQGAAAPQTPALPQQGYAPQQHAQAPNPEMSEALSAQQLARFGAELGNARLGKSDGVRLPAPAVSRVELKQVLVRSTFYGVKFIAEYDLRECSNPAGMLGGRYSWARSIDKDNDKYGHGMAETRYFVALIAEHLKRIGSITDWDGGLLDWISGASQPATGLLLDVQTKEKITQKNQNVLIDHTWSIASGGPLALPPAPQGVAALPPGVPGLPTMPPPGFVPQAAPPQMPPGFVPPGAPGGFAPPQFAMPPQGFTPPGTAPQGAGGPPPPPGWPPGAPWPPKMGGA